MKDEGSISQAELDALLSGKSAEGKSTAKKSTKTAAKKSTTKTTEKTKKSTSAKAPAKVTKTKAAEKKAPAKKVSVPKKNKTTALDSVKVEVTVLLGSKQYSVSELENYKEGEILELDRLVGEDVDVLANGQPVAKGVVVVADNNFAVKLTEVL